MKGNLVRKLPFSWRSLIGRFNNRVYRLRFPPIGQKGKGYLFRRSLSVVGFVILFTFALL